MAHQLVNGTIKQDELSAYNKNPVGKTVVSLARARGLELVQQMNDIQADKRITGEAVYRALDKINPEFSSVLRATVEGRVRLPTSAWANWQYRLRMVALGSKVDPGFNEQTADVRKQAYEAYAKGTQSQQIGSLTTAYRHMAQLDRDLDRMPNAIKRQFLARGALGATLGSSIAGVTEQDRLVWGALQREANTVNHEIEAALAMGRPTITGELGQERQIDLTSGDYTVMKGNLHAAREALQAKLEEWQDRFAVATGNQPRAMNSYFEHARALGDPDVATMREMQAGGAGTSTPQAGAPAQAAPAPAQAAPPQVGEVRRGWRYNGGDPWSQSSWERVNAQK
jgi:hypothetical protein